MAKTALTLLACVGASATLGACATAQKTGVAAGQGVRGGVTLASNGARMVKTTVGETYNGFGAAVRSPLRDFNMMQEKVPVALTKAKSHVYDVAGLTSCEAIAAQIAELDLALGPDVDTPKVEDQRTRSQRLASAAADGALDAARGALDHYIPYRAVVRQVSGARKYEKEVTRATLAGSVRRGFLKAIGMQNNCAWPAAPIWFQPKPAGSPVQLAANTAQPTVEVGALKTTHLVSVDDAAKQPSSPSPSPASGEAAATAPSAAIVVATARTVEPSAPATPASPSSVAPVIKLAEAPLAQRVSLTTAGPSTPPPAGALGFAGGAPAPQPLATSPGLR